MIFLYTLQNDELLYSPQGRMLLLMGIVVPILLSLLLWLIFGDFFQRNYWLCSIGTAAFCLMIYRLWPYDSNSLLPQTGLYVFVMGFITSWFGFGTLTRSPKLRRLRQWLGKLARSLFGRLF